MSEAAVRLDPDALIARLWREVMEAPVLLARGKDEELTGEGHRQLEQRARHASAMLVEALCMRHGSDLGATSAILLGFVWTASSVRPYLAQLHARNRQLADLDRAVEALGSDAAHSKLTGGG